jgi:hypothetical protein
MALVLEAHILREDLTTGGRTLLLFIAGLLTLAGFHSVRPLMHGGDNEVASFGYVVAGLVAGVLGMTLAALFNATAPDS